MKEIIERYIDENLKDRDFVTIKDFYLVYCAVEKWHDRTPITFYAYKMGLSEYFKLVSSIVVRTGYIYKIAYDLGCFVMRRVNKARHYFKFEWRKDWKRFNNYDIYCLKTFDHNAYHGQGALLAWHKEVNKSNNLKWVEVIDEKEYDDEDYT